MSITWSSAAGKHGIARDEVIFAMSRAHLVVDPFGPRRAGRLRPPALYIGPSQSGTLEILAMHEPPRHIFVFHVMRLRHSTAAAVGYEGEGT